MEEPKIRLIYNDYEVSAQSDGNEIVIRDTTLDREMSLNELLFSDLFEIVTRINDWVVHYAVMKNDYVDWLNDELKGMRDMIERMNRDEK